MKGLINFGFEGNPNTGFRLMDTFLNALNYNIIFISATFGLQTAKMGTNFAIKK
jgi:hypothetical protein